MFGTWSLTQDPAWPRALSDTGLPLLVLMAAALAGVTIWTYLGVPGASFRRVVGLLLLRLTALLAACLSLLRPSVAFRDEQHVPSTLVIAVDSSRSMTTQDAGPGGGTSRWAYVQYALRESESILRRLREQENVSVVFHCFDDDVRDFDPANPGKAEGSRTDFGNLLSKLYEQYRGKGALRGLVVISDGADNGTSEPPLPLAARWRNLPGRVYTIGVGRNDTREDEHDVKVVGINTDPPEVPIKNELTVKGTVDAPGFEGHRVRVQLFVDDKLDAVDSLDTVLSQSRGNIVQLKCLAPEKPGQMKVTVRVQRSQGEASLENNEASTFVRVIKEGISVLLVDRGDGCWETQMLCRNALRLDRRIRLTTREFRDDRANLAAEADYFNFGKEHYDVIIVGDVHAADIWRHDPAALGRMHDLIEQGTGLILLAGEASVGSQSDWRFRDDAELRRLPTEQQGLARQVNALAALLPVNLDVPESKRQLKGPVKMLPRAEGWDHYIMRLTNRDKNDAAWKEMHELYGLTKLGTLKPGAFALAESDVPDPDTSRPIPLLVGLDGGGRTLTLGVDTTYRWIVNEQGRDNHRRFWQQVVLWLAHREDARGGVWIEPERRRLATGEKLNFLTGLRDKSGEKLKDGTFTIKVTAGNKPKANPDLVPQEKGQRGTFWNTDEPGDYELEVTGEGKDAAGEPIKDTAKMRFHVYSDSAEMSPQPARLDFLKELKDAGGGQYHEAKDLARFLQDLERQPLPQSGPRTALWPDWKSPRLSGFLVGFFLAFVGLLSLEWYLRRRWGLV